MKKILVSTTILVVILSSLINVISCGGKPMGTDLSKIEKYYWNKEQPYFQGYELQKSEIAVPGSFKTISLNSMYSDSFFDLNKFNTGFKTKEEIQKQATTAVPLNMKFLPNGQSKSELTIVDRNEYFKKVNTINSWLPENDFDLKYNKSRIKLQKTEKVANKWVDSQDSNIQEMNMNTITSSTSMENTIIGNKRTYERSFNNYQYNDYLVSWAGSISEGIIVPPSKNQIEKAHINGTKILGNIFLDGYHGLNKQALKGFLEKDNNGNYKVVDILISLAIEMGFDGWFFNNEPNGENPNGFILDYRVSVEILNQLKNKIKSSSDSRIKELKITSYKNQGEQALNSQNQTTSIESEELYKNADFFVNDFFAFSNDLKKYMDKNNLNQKERFDIFNMYNAGAWVGGEIWFNKERMGTRDFRDLTHIPFSADGKTPFLESNQDFLNLYLGKVPNQTISFKEKDENFEYGGAQNSLAIFASHVPYDMASQSMDEQLINKKPNIETDTFGMVVANHYEDIMHTGKNKSLSNDDEGLSYYPSKIYDKDLKNKSYGIGNLIAEKTTLINDNPFFFTNFSTGQGNQFASYNEKGEREIVQNYPWSNANIGDVQPTYKWMINKQVNNKKVQLSDKSNISGYYDYYDPYVKGNSISLGSEFENDGQIKEAKWEKNTNYEWMIMGSNYTDEQTRDIEITFKAPENVANNASIVVEEVGSKNSKILEQSKSLSKIGDDGWYKITSKTNDKIAKIGLSFNTGDQDSFKISVGQMSVSKECYKDETNELLEQTEVDSEFILEDKKTKTKNIRLNFKNILNDSIYSYYEIYYKDKENKMIRVGETNSDNYFIKDIDINLDSLYVKKVNRNKSKSNIEWIKIGIKND